MTFSFIILIEGTHHIKSLVEGDRTNQGDSVIEKSALNEEARYFDNLPEI